ncbi:hypothetical protein TIFTF001_035836 [Ficus carica]|uniref:Uncharacterized protein n=1 Tax=Ficus carica TaxID=3494 RepID=A0AA88JA19_FICCA|nr:hypothetical protein TIFTF001_035836 [Ficus carica]
MHYSIACFPHALLVWAYENIPTIAGKFTTKHIEANPHMLSWTSMDNMKFDAVMSALTAIREKQAPRKTLVTQLSTETNSEWLEFQKKIRGEVDSINKKLEELKKGHKKSRKLLRRILKLLYNLNDNVEGKPTIAYHVSYRHKRNFQKDDLDAAKTDYDDL